VEFMPDLYDAERCDIDGMPVFGAGFLQTYALAGAEARGLRDGEVIAAANRYGKGRTLLIGFDLSLSYFRHSQEENRLYFASLLPFAGKRQLVGCDNEKIKARLHVDGQGNHALWALNMDPMPQACTLTFQKPVTVNATDHGEAYGRGGDGCELQLEIGGRDAFIALIGFGAAD
jgi:beta-galactosidase